MSEPFRANLEEIRRRAREHMSRGPVTSAYGIDHQHVIDVLNTVVATEMVCALRYRSHYHRARGLQAEAVADELLEHAVQEEDHAHRCAGRIAQLGGEPDLNPAHFTASAHSEYSTPEGLRDMLLENLYAERVAIDTYSRIIRWLGDNDPTTRRLMEDILEQEEEHADDLATMMALVPD